LLLSISSHLPDRKFTEPLRLDAALRGKLPVRKV
jgi:hypothetical protein